MGLRCGAPSQIATGVPRAIDLVLCLQIPDDYFEVEIVTKADDRANVIPLTGGVADYRRDFEAVNLGGVGRIDVCIPSSEFGNLHAAAHFGEL